MTTTQEKRMKGMRVTTAASMKAGHFIEITEEKEKAEGYTRLR